MFEIGWSEILVIAVVAIVVIGPKDLPRAMRVVGQWAGKAKRMGREFQNQFNEALAEAELDGMRKDIEEIAKSDPLAGVRNEMTKLDAVLKTDLAKPATPAVTADGIAAPVVGAEATAAPVPVAAVENAPAIAPAEVKAET
jgi:sec-independent protein translocase protein TatB